MSFLRTSQTVLSMSSHSDSYDDCASQIDLPVKIFDNLQKTTLFDALSKRRSVRSFDKNSKLKLSDLSQVLFAAQGVTKYVENDDDLGHGTLPRHTAPSGGGIYPISIYLLNEKDCIDDLKRGMYHYNSEKNALVGPCFTTVQGEIPYESTTTPFGTIPTDECLSEDPPSDYKHQEVLQSSASSTAAITTTPHQFSAQESAANYQTWINDASALLVFTGNEAKVKKKGDLYPQIAHDLIEIEVSLP